MRDVEGEPPEETARRELAEEAGLVPGRLDLLLEMVPSPAMTDSVTTIYLASDCTGTTRSPHGPEEQQSELLHIPLDDAVSMVERGEIVDAKTVAALLLTARRVHGSDHG